MSERPDERRLPPGARGLRIANAPMVSVVVASCGERELLDACLASLLPQCRERGAEVVVARAAEAPELQALERAYPQVIFVAAPPGSTLPELRAAGMEAADGDIVALTEDHRGVPPQWLAQLPGAPVREADAVGSA